MADFDAIPPEHHWRVKQEAHAAGQEAYREAYDEYLEGVIAQYVVDIPFEEPGREPTPREIAREWVDFLSTLGVK